MRREAIRIRRALVCGGSASHPGPTPSKQAPRSRDQVALRFRERAVASSNSMRVHAAGKRGATISTKGVPRSSASHLKASIFFLPRELPDNRYR